MSWEDPIVEEFRRYREAHAAKFNYDPVAIYNDILEQQKKSGLTYVDYSNEGKKAEDKTLKKAS